MDDFLAKPVTMERLVSILVKWLKLSPEPLPSATPPPTDMVGSPPLIDMDALISILGMDDPETLNEVLVEFVMVAKASLAEVAAAISNGRPEDVKAVSHGARGEARSVAAIGLAELYAELEGKARDGDRAVLQELLARSTAEIGRIEAFVGERLGQP